MEPVTFPMHLLVKAFVGFFAVTMLLLQEAGRQEEKDGFFLLTVFFGGLSLVTFAGIITKLLGFDLF